MTDHPTTGGSYVRATATGHLIRRTERPETPPRPVRKAPRTNPAPAAPPAPRTHPKGGK